MLRSNASEKSTSRMGVYRTELEILIIMSTVSTYRINIHACIKCQRTIPTQKVHLSNWIVVGMTNAWEKDVHASRQVPAKSPYLKLALLLTPFSLASLNDYIFFGPFFHAKLSTDQKVLCHLTISLPRPTSGLRSSCIQQNRHRT